MLRTISGIGRRSLSRTCSAVDIWSLNRGISCLAMLLLLNEGAGMIGAVECMSCLQESDVESSFGLSDVTISPMGKCSRAEW